MATLRNAWFKEEPMGEWPWVFTGLAVGILISSGLAWYRGALMRQELNHLRQTLNSWSGESERAVRAAHEELTELRAQLKHLAGELVTEAGAETPEACFTAIRESYNVKLQSLRALKKKLQKASGQLKSLQTQLNTARGSLHQTQKSGGMISGQLEEVQQLLAVTIAERDQLKYRVQELTRRQG